MSKKLTGWYSGDQKPVRVGWYQVKEGKQLNWHWDGEKWGFRSAAGIKWDCDKQNWTWRGLASDPAAKQVAK